MRNPNLTLINLKFDSSFPCFAQSPISNVSLLFQCLIFLGSREDEKTRPPSKPNPRRLLCYLKPRLLPPWLQRNSLWRSESSTSLYQNHHRLRRQNPKQPLPLRKPYLRRPLPHCLRRIFSRSGGTRMKFEGRKKATRKLSVACFGKTLAPPCLNSNRVISLSSLLPEVITFFFHS